MRSLRYLTLGLAVSLALVLVGRTLLSSAQAGVNVGTGTDLTIGQIRALVTQLDGYADQLPETPGITTREELETWADEILPYMSYEQIRTPVVEPTSLGWFVTTDGRRAFHVLGTAGSLITGCGPIEINGRMANPHSTWYGREDGYLALVHELVHVQGGVYCEGPSESVEADTQIAALEVAAAMVNHGNETMLRPWLLEMVDMGLASLQFYLPADEYEAFRQRIEPGPVDAARRAKSLRYWESNPSGLRDILYKYSVIPLGVIVNGARSGYMVRYPTLMLPADDTRYLLAHVGEIVAEVRS